MVLRMINMARLRDPKETGSHVQRVSSYAVEIYDRWAFKRGIDVSEQNKFRDMLKISAILHDVGKVGIPDAILKLPRAFTREEYDIIKTHTVIGALLFPSIESPLDAMARDVALHHHEHWDGSGYPGNVDMMQVTQENAVSMVNGTPLAGEDIPLAARIVALADVFDALSSKRVYKKAWSEEEVLAIGDGANDRSMLRIAGVGAAVYNADAETKSIADYCCKASYTEGVIEAVAVQDDSSTKRTCRFHLKDWGRCGHADDGAYAEFLRGICNSLCMITG